MTASFRISLTDTEWEDRLNGWRCQILSFPGAKLIAVAASGFAVDEKSYRASGSNIIWTESDPPKQLSVTIELEKVLVDADEEKLALEKIRVDLERDKAKLEQEKFRADHRWKYYTAAGTALSACFTFATTLYLSGPKTDNSPQALNDIGLIEFFSKSNDFLSSGKINRFGAALEAAKREVWFVGTSFYISTDTYFDVLLRKLQEGIHLNFLVMDPESVALPAAATMLGTSQLEIKNQANAGLQTLAKLSIDSAFFRSPGKVTVRLASEPLTLRMYFFDPKVNEGQTYYVPQVNGVNSQTLPGFLVRNKPAKFHEVYFSAVQKFWDSKSTITFDEWAKSHPETKLKPTSN